MTREHLEPYHARVFKTKGSKIVVFFACPFYVKIWMTRHIVASLQRSGYTVVAYDAPKEVFTAADPSLLKEVVHSVKQDIKRQIDKFQQEGVEEFGFFGTSLGSFILYNCINDCKELKWGVLNTSGNIAQAIWRMSTIRKKHEAKGVTLNTLEKEWYDLQHPVFGDLNGHIYAFVSSKEDRLAPLGDVRQYLLPIRDAGAKIGIIEVKAVGHIHAAIAGLAQAASLLAQVRNGNVGRDL